jgi:peroxiredoxin
VNTVGKPSVPSLQDELDRITKNTRALVQPERLAYSEQATAELFATGIEQRVLPVDALSPKFTLIDALTGKPVRSDDVLSLGPLVVKFFRGRWCPYCATELEVWRDLYPEIRRRGAFFLAISPQNRRHNDFTLQQHNLSFPILSDPDALVGDQFGVGYTVPEKHREYYKSIMVNIPFVNSGVMYPKATEESWRLPIPAVFVIRQDGTVAFSQGYADFRVRPEPADVLAALDAVAAL